VQLVVTASAASCSGRSKLYFQPPFLIVMIILLTQNGKYSK
jgi:hypothetical protein